MSLQMTENEFHGQYWNYYIQLENDFFALEPFCSIDTANSNSFSVKYLQLILSICGEIDTICKRLCYCLDETIDVAKVGIDDYRAILMANYPQIADECVSIKRHNYRKIKPFQSWAFKHNPQWWDAYNRIKHHRDEDYSGKKAYQHATQKNVIDALAGLYIVEIYWAAYTFVLKNGLVDNIIMNGLKSTQLVIENWKPFYQGVVGRKYFNADTCRKYFISRKEYANE